MSFFPAKQFCVFHKYSRGKKSICESNSLRGLHQMKMLFFLNPPHLTQEVFFLLLFVLSLSVSLFLVFYLWFELWHPNLPQDVCHKLQSNVVTMLFFFPCLLWPSFFFLFLFLFSVFSLSRSGAPDVKRPRYGFIPFYLGSGLFLEELTQPLAPETFSKLPLFLLTYSSAFYLLFVHVPSFLAKSSLISLTLFNILPCCYHPLSCFIPSFIYLSILVLTPVSPSSLYLLPSLCAFLCPPPICVPPLVLSYGSRPGPSPLTTFDPADLTQGLKVTFFCYPSCLG